MSIDEMIEVLQAAKAGKKIQYRASDGNWYTQLTTLYDFVERQYRVKPEPREWWAVCTPKHKAPMRETEAEARRDLMYSDDTIVHVLEVLP